MYSNEESSVVLMLAAIDLGRASAKLYDDFRNACGRRVYAPVQSLLINSAYAMIVILYKFCEPAVL